MAVQGCKSNTEIIRVPYSSLSADDFLEHYFKLARPVIITGMTDDWACRKWTIEGLMDKVGDNEVLVRGNTNTEDYKLGKAYTIKRSTFRRYCEDLLEGNARARSSYLAVGSLQQAFPQLLSELPLPEYLVKNGKLHLGPYMWVALKGHYEFCHYDPDDNFLIMIQGRKQLRLFGLNQLQCLYPNPTGSQGKTIQSQVNLDSPDLDRFPLFREAECQHCILHPGEVLFIPAFYWHQVTALDSGISCNMFYGNGGENNYLEKILSPPYKDHFEFWLLNIVEQNKEHETFPKILGRLPEVLWQFFLKQWHENGSPEQIQRTVNLIMNHFGISELPDVPSQSKFPPLLKIRGLRGRVGKE